ncbi:MAG: phosphatase PAP2 family protein [Candidatus Micrarchaeota archaeon]
MDTITSIALSVDSPILKAAGMVLDGSIAYAAIVLALVLIGESRNDKRLKLMASLALTALLVTIVKTALAHERPCSAEAWCPPGYSFPSTHAAIAFTLMTGFLNKKSYPLFLLFALFVSFTRMNLGVHVFEDIAGALPVALISYYLTDMAWKMRAGSGKPAPAAGSLRPETGGGKYG